MRVIKFVFALFCGLCLAGCWGARETDEIAYVMAMGFDKGPGDSIVVTFQLANPKAIAGQSATGGGGGGVSQNKPFLNSSMVAALPIGAFNLENTQRSREISLLHTNAFIFSDELSREGLGSFLRPLNRYRETRGTAFIFVCRGKAREFMDKNQPMLEQSPSKQFELFSRGNRLHSLASVARFREFYQNTKSLAGDPVAPLVAISRKSVEDARAPEPGKLGDYLAGDLPSKKGEIQFIGTAVFSGDRMVGDLTGDETRYLNMINGEMDQSFIIIEDPKKAGYPVGITLRQAKVPDVKVNFSSGTPQIEVHIYQEPELVGITSGINYESPKLKEVLENELERIIKKRCLDLVARSQEEFRADIFGFGRYGRMKFLTTEEWKKAGWKEAYPTASVEINVHVKIRRTGLMLKTSPSREDPGEER